MAEKVQHLANVYCTGKLSQQVTQFGRELEELRQAIRVRLRNLQDAAKVKQNTTQQNKTKQNNLACCPGEKALTHGEIVS